MTDLRPPRTDYPANRGPLDGREYVRRRPDPFSVVAGCLFLLLWLAIGTVAWLVGLL
jgi:hypothetical protein